MIIPPHMYLSDTRLLIGDDDKSKLKGGQPADKGAAA
jgi:hypothetical protein